MNADFLENGAVHGWVGLGGLCLGLSEVEVLFHDNNNEMGA